MVLRLLADNSLPTGSLFALLQLALQARVREKLKVFEAGFTASDVFFAFGMRPWFLGWVIRWVCNLPMTSPDIFNGFGGLALDQPLTRTLWPLLLPLNRQSLRCPLIHLCWLPLTRSYFLRRLNSSILIPCIPILLLEPPQLLSTLSHSFRLTFFLLLNLNKIIDLLASEARYLILHIKINLYIDVGIISPYLSPFLTTTNVFTLHRSYNIIDPSKIRETIADIILSWAIAKRVCIIRGD